MVHDIKMRWIRRWWFGFIPHWVLQYRKRVDVPTLYMGHENTRWTEWEDVNYVSEGEPEL